MGQLDNITVSCASGTCDIPVYAPSIAIVYLSDEALSNSSPHAGNGVELVYSTTVVGTATATQVNPAVLATSNGRLSGKSGTGRYVFQDWFNLSIAI